MSVMRNDLSPRPAFYAYKTMAGLLAQGQYAGAGELMRAVPNQWQPQFDLYHYRFSTPAGVLETATEAVTPSPE